MTSVLRFLVLGSLFLSAVHPDSAFSQQNPASAPSDIIGQAANPFVEEMQVLDRGFREIVSAVSLGDRKQVRSSLQPMYVAAEKAGQGVKTGTIILPKNDQRMKDFIKLDRAFHEKLKSLGRTAQHNNAKEMVRITKQLLDDCVQCHRIFRK